MYTNIFHSKVLPYLLTNWDFWFENIPSGNPATPLGKRVLGSSREQMPMKH
jgi:hypothetical protein